MREQLSFILDWFKSLATSRKFWLSAVGVIYAYIQLQSGAIDAAQFTDALQVLIGILVGAIALEDAAHKYNKK